MDNGTAEAVFRLWLQDVDHELKHGNLAKDQLLAFQSLRDGLKTRWMNSFDRGHAIRILQQEQGNQMIIANSVAEENIAVSDREMAHRLAGMPVPQLERTRTQRFLEQFTSAAARVEREEAGTIKVADEVAPLLPTVSAGLLMDKDTTMTVKQDDGLESDDEMLDMTVCTICLEARLTVNVVQLPCKPNPHMYCNICLFGLFNRSMKDKALFPPRCCRINIPIKTVENFFTKSFVRRFQERQLELTTPNPTYCYNKRCSAFIRPDQIKGDAAKCAKCGNKTCKNCKNANHQGKACPKDEGTRQLMELAKGAHWQRCYHCRNLVELTIGCNHITCHCGKQFCYVCALPWKTCQCEIWEEERLMAAATRRVANRRPANRQGAAAARVPDQAEIARAAEVLRGNHECDHNGQTEEIYDDDEDEYMECDYCGDELEFLVRCVDCDEVACRRCLLNRW